MAVPDFNVFDFFKEEIRNDSAPIKIGAINRLNLIASALGATRTVNELIPYLGRVAKEDPFADDEEFLFSLAKEYATLADFINGRFEVLVAPLEHLAAQEETVIRDQAVKSICIVLSKMPSLGPDLLVATLERLASKTDFFTARVSACSLLPPVYKHATEEQRGRLRGVYNALCSDETPMVRRAAAQQLKDFLSVCSKNDILADLLGTYKQLSQEDTQDSIRVAGIKSTFVLAQMFDAAENQEHTISFIVSAPQDRSWRVRLTVVSAFPELCKAFGPEATSNHFMQPFISFLQDNEQEVRKEAVRVIEPMLAENLLSVDQLESLILPQFQSLGLDSAQTVRAALGQVLGPVAKALGKDITQRHLLSLISDLMKDEFHDVRLNIVSHAGLLCEVLSADGLVHSLLHTIQSLIMDNHWRIRHSVVEQVPKLARIFGVQMFQSKLEAVYLTSLRDSVYSVRQAAISHLKEITDIFGSQWTVEHLLPKLVEQYSQSAGYAQRVTTLEVLPQVSGVMTTDQIVQFIVPLLVKATKDTVPNVRFAACRTIEDLMNKHNLGSVTLNTIIKPTVSELESDTDIDVQYFAHRANAQCNN